MGEVSTTAHKEWEDTKTPVLITKETPVGAITNTPSKDWNISPESTFKTDKTPVDITTETTNKWKEKTVSNEFVSEKVTVRTGATEGKQPPKENTRRSDKPDEEVN